MEIFNTGDKQIAQAIKEAGDDIAKALVQIAQALAGPPPATKLVLMYSLQGGTIMGKPVSGTVGQVYTPTVTESNPTTPSIQPIGPLVFSTDTPAIVATDPNTGLSTLVSAGTAIVSALDQGNGLTDTVTFTVAPAVTPATVLDLEFNLTASTKSKK